MDLASLWPQVIQGCVIVVLTQLIGFIILHARNRRSTAKNTAAAPSLTVADQILQQIEEQRQGRH